ncbi:hypothetical protein [Kutzneria chonburiensis]|uniref:Uncharacterized protein n=1 Tax=Kutzneria chonburiensis TaxID=1483604 RepID=A0ABV6ML18_9PSEU|nr:hypothetical protein [Kutzneria chonburiensis]
MPKSFAPPTDRFDLDQLTAIVAAGRDGHSTLNGTGLTSTVADGEARQHRDHRAAARPAPETTSTIAAPTGQVVRPPRRLRPRRTPQPVRPGVLPVATTSN